MLVPPLPFFSNGCPSDSQPSTVGADSHVRDAGVGAAGLGGDAAADVASPRSVVAAPGSGHCQRFGPGRDAGTPASSSSLVSAASGSAWRAEATSGKAGLTRGQTVPLTRVRAWISPSLQPRDLPASQSRCTRGRACNQSESEIRRDCPSRIRDRSDRRARRRGFDCSVSGAQCMMR